MTMEPSSDSVIWQMELNEAIGGVAIAAQIDEVPSAFAKHELSSTALAAERHFIDQQIQRARDAIRNLSVYPIAGGNRCPRGDNRCRRRPALELPDPHARRGALRNENPRAKAPLAREIELNAIAVDVGKLIVISVDSGRVDERVLTLMDVDRDMEHASLPPERDIGRWLAGVGPSLLGTAIVRLTEM